MRLTCLAVAVASTGCGIADFDITEQIPAQTIQGSGIPAPLAGLFQLPLNATSTSNSRFRRWTAARSTA
jgi:hypothetical protein